MTALLLILSLMLNAAAIFAIILLYLRQNRLLEAEKKQEKIIEELEQIFSGYLLELREENEQFIELAQKAFKEKNHAPENEAYAGSVPKQDVPPETDANPGSKAVAAISYQAAKKAYSQNGTYLDHEEAAMELPLYDAAKEAGQHELKKEPTISEKIFELKNNGHSIEEIARKLDKGKTEIELLLKFRQNGKE